MRLKKLDRPEDILIYYKPDQLWVEEKFDGFKVFASKNSKLHLYTRRGVEFTENIPSLIKKLEFLPKNTAILGELVVINEKGKQSLADIQSIVNSHPNHAHLVLHSLKGRLVFFIYDLLEYKGENITKKPLVYRRKLLNTLIQSNLTLELSSVYPFSKYKQIIKKSLSKGGEGIVIKAKNSIYKYNKLSEHEPSGEWYKYKPSHTEDVILNSYFYRGKEKKAIFPAYQYKQIKNGRYELFEVGKLSGMDRITEKYLMDKIDKKGIMVVEVNYQEKYPSGKIRAMGWVRDRTKEKSPKDAIWQK